MPQGFTSLLTLKAWHGLNNSKIENLKLPNFASLCERLVDIRIWMPGYHLYIRSQLKKIK